MTINELRDLALHAVRGTAPAEFTIDNVNDALNLHYYGMQKNRESIPVPSDYDHLSKEEMLGYIVDILADDDITANGVIIVAPQNSDTDWPGDVIEIPGVPERDSFVEAYKDAAMSGITAILAYHGQQMMLTYRPAVGTISVILILFHDLLFEP